MRFLIVSLLIIATNLFATIINIPDDFETIQAGIDEAEDGDTVLVADGVYRGDGNRDISFQGKAIVVMSENGPDECIIDVEEAEDHRGFRFSDQETRESVLDGFKITGGNIVTHVNAGGYGGGITISHTDNEHSSPTIRNCYIINNYSSVLGGGISIGEDSHPLIENCVIALNRCGAQHTGCGGGISVVGPGGRAEIINCTITENTCPAGDGIAVRGNNDGANGVVTIVNSIVFGNGETDIFVSEGRLPGEDNFEISYSDIGEDREGDGNINEAPLFVDEENGDYHLTEDSPCIDAGDPESPEDPDGTRADMGAFYFHQEEEDGREVRLLGRYDTPGRAYGVKVYGEYAFVANDWEGLRIIDISDPENPDEVGYHDTPSFAISVFVSANYAYVADMHGGLRVMDVSDLENPEEVENLETPDEAIDVTIVGNIAYVADRASGLRIVDISDPENIEELGHCDTPGYASSVDVLADFAFIADHNGGLRIISVSDPENPEEVGQLDTPDLAEGVAISGNYAYVADWESGLRIVDVSDPENPEEIAGIDTPDRARDLAVRGNYAFIANQGSGLRIIDISDPENPEEVGFYDTDGQARDVFVSSGIAYVADDGNGLVILDISDFTGDEPNDGELSVSFSQNWNLISINVSPGQEFYDEEDDRGPDIELMMEQLRIDEDNHHVFLMKNERGRFYVPAIPFNNIPYWDLTRGYMVKVDEDCEATWTGEPIPADADIWVNENWNMIAYFPNYELDMSSPDFYGISPIVDNVIIMKDSRGRFAVPWMPFSNMTPLRPTQGYQIKVDEDVLLNYPPEQEGERIAVVSDVSMNAAIPSSSNLSLLVDGLTEDVGAVVTVVDLEGNIVGQGTSDSDGRCGIAVWGDDPSTEEKEGLSVGESFKLQGLHVKEFVVGDGLVYEQDAFIAVNVTVSNPIPDEYYLSEGYPNPFNSQVRLSYGLPEQGLLKINVFEVTGRLVTTLINQEQTAGRYNVTWHASDYPSGLYMIRIEAGGFINTKKVMLIR